MAGDLDRNNNMKTDDSSERMKKKRFSSVLNFFNDIIGKTSSLSGLDNSTSSSSKSFSIRKKSKRHQSSAPDLTHINNNNTPSFNNSRITTDNKHKRIAPTMSVPASLNLPRATFPKRPILSTNSLNKADINEEWLRPTRYRNYQANGNIDYYQSDISLDSFTNSSSRLNLAGGAGVGGSRGSTLERRLRMKTKNQSVRFSFDNLHKKTTNEYDPTVIKRCYSNSTELRSQQEWQNQQKMKDGDAAFLRKDLEDALDVLRGLDQNLQTQSEKNLMQVGAFMCSVERSKSSSDLPKVIEDDTMESSLTNAKEAVITVCVDHDQVFGDRKKNLRQQRLTREKRTNGFSMRGPSIRLSERVASSDNCLSEVEELKLADVLCEPIENSFWGNADTIMLHENEIRKIAENEARQIIDTSDYQEQNVKKWTKSITCNVRDKIRAYTGRAFKVVVNALVGNLVPSTHDTVNVMVRGLTDPDKDRFVVAAFEIDDMFISVTCILIRIPK